MPSGRKYLYEEVQTPTKEMEPFLLFKAISATDINNRLILAKKMTRLKYMI